MKTTQDKIEALKEFIERDKFSWDAWNARGLNPSDHELCEYLKKVFNYNAQLLIEALQKNSSNWKLKRILKSRLTLCRPIDYDTEEREFISDLFFELSAIIEVDIRHTLNIWLYGRFLIYLTKIVKFFRPERILEVVSQSCTKCSNALEAHVLSKENGIPDRHWIIGKCKNCEEYNLFSHGPNIKRIRYKTFFPTDYLSKDEYTFQQAQERLEQIKYFRK